MVFVRLNEGDERLRRDEGGGVKTGRKEERSR